jgi:hypothetical protein
MGGGSTSKGERVPYRAIEGLLFYAFFSNGTKKGMKGAMIVPERNDRSVSEKTHKLEVLRL